MMRKLFCIPAKCFAVLLLVVVITGGCSNQQAQERRGTRTIVEVEFSRHMAYQQPSNFVLKEVVEIEYAPVTDIQNGIEWNSVRTKIKSRVAKWEIFSDETIQANYGLGRIILINPGDSIRIRYDGYKCSYSGKGAEKLIAWNRLMQLEDQLQEPAKSNNIVNSIDEYMLWNRFVDHRLALQLEALTSYKETISQFEYDFIKSFFVNTAESDLIQTFIMLVFNNRKEKTLGLENADLIAIWDSTQYKPWNQWFRSLSTYYGDTYELWEFNKAEVWRKFSFNMDNDSLKSMDMRTHLYYTNAKQNHSGILRERLLSYIIEKEAIGKMGLSNPTTQAILKDYLSQTEYPEYKANVKEYIEKAKKVKSS